MILDLYFARKYFTTFLGVFFVLAVLVALIDFIDEIQRFPDLDVAKVSEIVFLKLPGACYEILPLVVILATVAMFARLSKSSELAVVRAAGRSAFRALAGPIGVSALIGLTSLAMINPIVAATAKRYSDVVKGHRDGNSSVLAISSEGLWLRQGGPSGQTVIHSTRVSSDLSLLYDATFVSFSPEGVPLSRISAETARLADGEWHLSHVKKWDFPLAQNPESKAQEFDALQIPSALTQDRIRNSFGKPKFIPIWDLPDFIDQLEQAGFSARRYSVWFQMELANPLFLVALVLIAASFTMQHVRGSQTGLSVLVAIMLGFGLHYIRNFSQILGENGQIPVLLAAWAPPVASLFVAIGLLLHMEDG